MSRRNPVLRSGEPGYETDTQVYKIGDGVTPWSDLQGYPNESMVVELVRQALVAAGAGATGVSHETFSDHVTSESPHPVYDNGASFLLAYQNAKV